MAVLNSSQRSGLEKTVTQARKLAEAGAFHALQALAVNESEPFKHQSPEERTLRNRLRAKGRLLGDKLENGKQELNHLAYELAYEYWHKMLFAQFLEANGLLMHPSGVAVTMEDCEELAKEEGYTNKWEAAASYASKELPAIFRVDDPLMKVEFAPNDRIALESLLENLRHDIYVADDALGWVYQFWQSEAKEIINKSGDKIDGEKLPAVTQLFTEPYMVHFLIDNTIGAWWVSRNPGMKRPLEFEYLRLLEDGTPAAGRFEGWPDKTAHVTALDPCMGSGHFIAALFQVFVRLRMHEEGLSKEDATDKVIQENLHGLEIDPRCTQIAAFNLALAAWKFCGRHRPLPEMNLACSGVAPKGKQDDWVKLVGNVKRADDKVRLENGMRMLYDHFQLAPELGSLIDPSTIKPDAFTASFQELQPVLAKALQGEADKDQIERGVMAAGIAKAGYLLSGKYTLQITNVPYLSRGKQERVMADYCAKQYPEAKGDLATVFLEKMLKGNTAGGIACSVIPQNWLFLTSYKRFREKLLKNEAWSIIARLGPKGFQTPMWDFNVMLISIQHARPSEKHTISGLDVSEAPNATAKDDRLKEAQVKQLVQKQQFDNPDSRVVLERGKHLSLLNDHAECFAGILNGDSPRFQRNVWELNDRKDLWTYQQTTVDSNKAFGGLTLLIYYDSKNGHLREDAHIRREKLHDSDQRGNKAWGKLGIGISQMSSLPVSLYTGAKFDSNIAVIYPKKQELVLPIWLYCQSDVYKMEVRKIDQKINVTNATLVKVPFDLEHWEKVANEKYPNGLPKPYSDDPSQWLFHGNPLKTTNSLIVACARVLGYRWPAEVDNELDLSMEARKLIESMKASEHLSDDDGILSIPSVNGEPPASETLRNYLKQLWGRAWQDNTIEQLLRQEGSSKNNLEEWFRDEFFIHHCKLFQNRPFVWHIWDGRKDGFGALVNYHKLTKENLQKLIYTYLGDWIRRCESRLKAGQSGADGQVSAAKKLKEKLELILEGEAPYDIFVRWKTSEQQPIGWDPDLNDGVRLNIRPFIEADVLRKKPKIKWGIDRGKNPPGSPWGEIRDNDRHLTLKEKREARAKQEKK